MRPRTSHLFALATTLLFALLLYFLRFGYDFGHSDQDEFLPLLFHRLDPQLFTGDWFVMGQHGQFNVRYFFITLLQEISWVFPPWLAVLLVYLASWALITSAVFQVSLAFCKQTWVASLVVILTLVFTPQWTLGGNDLVHRMLVPSMLAWGLGLWGFTFFLQKRLLWAATLLALATWMQALVGLQLALCCGLFSLLYAPDETAPAQRWGDAVKFGIIYLFLSSPLLFPLLLQQLRPASPPSGEGPDLFFILASFRAPHHYLYHSFSLSSRLKLFTLFFVAVLFLIRFIKHTHPVEFRRLILLFGILGGVMITGYSFSEIVPVLFITKLQLFKLSVLAKVLFIIIICTSLNIWLPDTLRSIPEHLISSKTTFAFSVFASGVVLIGLLLQWPFLAEKVRPWMHKQEPLSQVEQWIREASPVEAVFAIPPSMSGFRTRAERAIVVNFKAYPFQDEAMQSWFRRLTDMAPIAIPERGGSSVLPLLDLSFQALPDTTLSRLSARYGFEYVLRKHTPDTMRGWETAFVRAPWAVYRVKQEVP